MAAKEEEPIGFIEVEFGPISEGRPVQKAMQTRPERSEEKPDPEPVQEAPPKVAPPIEAKPVDLPKPPAEVVDEEVIQTPKAETISPEKANNPEPVKKPEPETKPDPIRPLGGGAVDGTTGAEEGDEGAGAEERKTAPFQIEGLNRVPVYSTVPVYRAQVNALIKVRITVDPQGRIVQRIPLLKGNPELEQAVMEALQRWRFNPLPPNAPQENQTGVVTFRFRLE